MLAYLIMIGVPILYAMSKPVARTWEQYQKKQRTILMLFFALYFCLLALRHTSLGNDTNNYVYYFHVWGNAPWERVFNQSLQNEPAFYFLCKLIYTIWGHEQFFLAVISFLIVGPVAYLYIRETENALMTIAIFLSTSLFVMFFSGMRQSLAVAMMVPIYYFTKKKKVIPYLLCVGVACLFHISAVVVLPFYIVYHMRVSKRGLLVVVPTLIAGYVFNKQLFSLALRFLETKYVESYGKITATGAYSMLLLYVVFGVYAFLVPEESRMDSDTVGLRNLLVFSIFLQFFAPLNNVAMRMNYYYILFHPLVLPKIANRAKLCNKQIAILSRIVICLFFFFYFIYQGYTFDSDVSIKVFPYIPFWKEV